MVDIRLATQQNLPQLADLVREELEQQRRVDPSSQLNPDVDWTEYVSAKLRRTDAEILVAEKGGTLVGYIDVRIVQQGRTSTGGRLKEVVLRLGHPFRRESANGAPDLTLDRWSL